MRSLLKREGELILTSSPISARGAYKHRFKGSDHSRVELTLNGLGHSKSGDLAWHSVTIRALRGHGVVGIGDRDDP